MSVFMKGLLQVLFPRLLKPSCEKADVGVEPSRGCIHITKRVNAANGRGCRQRGFTLVELLFVIAIIGIFVGIAIPYLVGARNRASQTVARSNLASIHSAVADYIQENEGASLTGLDDLTRYLDNDLTGDGVKGDYKFVLTSSGGADWTCAATPTSQTDLHRYQIDQSGRLVDLDE